MKQNNATAVNKTILDDTTGVKHSEKVLSAIKKTENAGGSDEKSIVDRYALVKQNKSALQWKMTKVNNELQERENETITYAKENRVSILYGKEFTLQVTEVEKTQFPYATDPRRKDLESLVKQMGFWESVSAVNLSKLKKYLRDNMFNKKIIDVLRMATMVKKTKVSLIRRMDRY
jgi:hypothetical protein